jgi:O-antigen/teichoic acid export membrane protein
MKISEGGFGSSVIRGMRWIGAGMVLQTGLRLGVLAVLTRMVAPHDFGLIAIAFICTSCAERVGQVGIAPAFIQKERINDDDVVTAVRLSVLSGILITLALCGAAPFVAIFFREPGVEGVLSALAFGFLIDAYGVVPDGMLQRQLRFREIVRAETSAYVIGAGCVGIGGAMLGAGVWALVASHIVMKIVRVFLVRAAVSLPRGGTWSRESARGLLGKGIGFSAGRILNFISLQGDNFVVGRLLGTDTLGMYSRAYQVMTIPAMVVGQIFERVLFPALAQKQSDAVSMRRAFSVTLEVATLVALPATVVMYLLSDEIILVLFGEKWLVISPVLSVLSLGVFCRTTYKCGDTVVRSQGELVGYTTRQMWYTLIVLIGSWAGASLYGVLGVAWAVVGGVVVNYVLMTQLAARLINLPFNAVVRAHLPGAWVAVFVGMAVHVAIPYARTIGGHPLLTLAMIAAVVVSALGASVLFGWGILTRSVAFTFVRGQAMSKAKAMPYAA